MNSTPQKPIDLRSDTVTRPNAKMRRAMAEAEVGDDVFSEDPTINRLQARSAELFGREAALFVPSGSMGNLTAIAAQTQPGQEVICESRCHVYNYEMGAMAAIAGVLPRIVEGDDGILTWDQIAPAIQPKIGYRAQTGLICLENTHNMAGGTVFPPEISQVICEKAHERGLPVHLDGSRIFNASVALGKSVAEITRGFDSINFCFSKGLGAPVGSMVVGSRELIDRVRRYRKMLGGGMRQAGVLAAAALVALEDSPTRLHIDHENARYLADRLAAMPGIQFDPEKVVTNIVIFDVTGTGMDSAAFLAKLADKGVLAVPVNARRVRMVTHCDITREEVELAMKIVASIVSN